MDPDEVYDGLRSPPPLKEVRLQKRFSWRRLKYLYSVHTPVDGGIKAVVFVTQEAAEQFALAKSLELSLPVVKEERKR